MNKKIILFTFALLSVLFLTAQTCTFSYLQYDYDCSDGLKSLGEADVDCGGAYCDPCSEGDDCEDNDDCASGLECDETTDACVATTEGTTTEPTTTTELTDTDGDGVADADDVCSGYDDNEDTDSDGTPDGCDDSDEDGLTDAEEIEYGTAANDADSDDDGLTDGEEITSSLTDPLLEDTDDDNISDSDEVKIYNTDPLKSDSDGDGVSDQVEIEYVDTNPLDATDYPAIADCGGLYEAGVGEEVTFDGSASVQGTRTITHYYWNMGDGTSSGPQTAATYAYTYSAAGEYAVMLLLRGDSGTLLDTCTTTATITEAAETGEEETSAEAVEAYTVTDITDASIDGTIGSTLIHFLNYEALSSSWTSMGNLVVNSNSYTDGTGNPTAASPLLVGILSRTYWSGIDTERILTVTAADGSTFDLYLPVVDASVLTGYAMVFYVAADGSTYYADADHTGVLSDRSNLLAPEDALTADNLARAVG